MVSITDLAEICGVEPLWIVEAEDIEAQLRPVFRQALSSKGLNMIIVRQPCQAAS